MEQNIRNLIKEFSVDPARYLSYFDDIVLDAKFFECLKSVGVDSWEGYEEAQDLFTENNF